MKRFTHSLLSAAALSAGIILPAHGAILQFSATIDSAQETTGSNSSATGSAVMIYDTDENTFDLSVTIQNFPNTLADSHIHEAAAGVAGPAVTTLGNETAYSRVGNTISGQFLNVTYGGDPATLVSGGAYLNFHTAAWTGGEVRGQLIPESVKLTAIMDPSQETGTVASGAFGAAQVVYDPASNEIDLTIFVYNFTNTLANSHIHEAPLGVDGSVVTPIGDASVYQQFGNTYTQKFENLPYGGDPVALLSGGAYVNVHSDAFSGGEIRGQLFLLDENNNSRLTAVSARGEVSPGDGSLITGFIIEGSTPLRVIVTGRGPILGDFGVSNFLADPFLAVQNFAGTVLLTNDSAADGAYPTEIIDAGVVTTATEAAVVMILPPGAYTSVLSGVGDTSGIALAEAFQADW